MKKRIKHNWVVMAVLIGVVLILSYSLRLNESNKSKFVLEDIDELIQGTLAGVALQDPVVKGIEGEMPTRIYVKSKDSLELTYSIAESILKRYQNEDISYDGPAMEIYFGDYVILHQGRVTLQKIDEKGNRITIKTVSPAGEKIAEKIHRLEKMVDE